MLTDTEKKKRGGPIRQLWTKWGRELDPEHVLPEYPCPQYARENWVSLNGVWDYAFTKAGEKPRKWDGPILVPFSPESVLSGVGRQLMPDEALWYHRRVPGNAVPLQAGNAVPSRSGNTVSPQPENAVTPRPGTAGEDRIFLRFGAVDQTCAVYCNGKKAGTHTGGYLPFSVDITSSWRNDSENDIAVAVRDVSDTSYHSRGKQKLERGGMYYTAVSGIWQSVFLERVPAEGAGECEMRTDPESRTVSFGGLPAGTVVTVARAGIYRDAEFDYAAVFRNGIAEPVVSGTAADSGRLTLAIPENERKTWSPEEPYLYYALIECGRDRVITYFAFRTVAVQQDESGYAKLFLNGRPFFTRGVLDQGYWPDGIYTAPSDEALLFDVREMKRTGFNTARKHAKIEAERWYYHCDRTGLPVWQDMVNGGSPYADWYVTYLASFAVWAGVPFSDRTKKLLSRTDAAGRAEFEREMEETVRALGNHPGILVWTLFNEGWGQFDTVRLTEKLRKLDPSRPVDAASGWYDRGCGDFVSRHFYFFTLKFRPEERRAFVVSECGGYALHDGEHSACENIYGYRIYETKEELAAHTEELLRGFEDLSGKGMAGYVYTQWSDIEEEINGVYTYDRAVRKIDSVPR